MTVNIEAIPSHFQLRDFNLLTYPAAAAYITRLLAGLNAVADLLVLYCHIGFFNYPSSGEREGGGKKWKGKPISPTLLRN